MNLKVKKPLFAVTYQEQSSRLWRGVSDDDKKLYNVDSRGIKFVTNSEEGETTHWY